MAYEISNIDVGRLFADLQVSKPALGRIASLNIPHDVRVPSVSAIKTETVAGALHIVDPAEDFDVIGVKAPSGVAEQPLGQAAIDGAINRLNNGMSIREQVAPGEAGSVVWISIENGLFRVPQEGVAPVEGRDGSSEGVLQLTEDADLSSGFDPDAAYEDRAVVAIRAPGHPTIVQVSPGSEAVRFPKAAVLAAYHAEGGFERHTAASKLAEMGLVVDKQNPHTELTADRPGGPLPRQDQMTRVIIRALLQLTRQ